MKYFAAAVLVLGGATMAMGAEPASAPAAGEAKVEVINLMVLKEIDRAALDRLFDSHGISEMKQGTALVMKATLPKGELISVDKLPRLTTFGDDKDTDFGDGRVTRRFSSDDDSQVLLNADREHCTFWLFSPKLPAAGAEKILLKEALVARAGRGETVAESKVLAVKLGQAIVAGAYTLNVQSVSLERGEGNGETITLACDQPLEKIKKMECTDGEGKAVATTVYGANYRQPVGEGKQIVLTLARPVKEASFKLVFFEKIERVEIPFDLTVKVGL